MKKTTASHHRKPPPMLPPYPGPARVTNEQIADWVRAIIDGPNGLYAQAADGKLPDIGATEMDHVGAVWALRMLADPTCPGSSNIFFELVRRRSEATIKLEESK